MIKYINNKGITLLALSITIIILLILAGVSISMIRGENGLLNLTKNAKDHTNDQIVFEQIQMAAIAAMRNPNYEVNKEQLDKELEQYGYGASSGNETDGYTVTVGDKTYVIDREGNVSTPVPVVTEPPTTEVAEKTKFQDTQSNNKIAVIPKGFKVSSETDEQRIDTGLVVIAPDGSEFVWVPVENLNSMYGTLSDGNLAGKVYEFTKEGAVNALNWSEENGVMKWQEENHEPYIVAGTHEGDATERGLSYLSSIIGIQGEIGKDDEMMLNTWKKQLQNEFDEMIKFVKVSGGFYIGRYETSLTLSENAQSKKGEIPATDIPNTWYGLYQKEKEYSEKNGLSNDVGSSMIWGCQYDQMLIWMKNNGIDVASEEPIPGAFPNIGDNGNALGKTGIVETDKLNNIYDLMGSSEEWTMDTDGNSFRYSRRGII